MSRVGVSENPQLLWQCTDKDAIKNYLIAKKGIPCNCEGECTEALHFDVQRIVYFSRKNPARLTSSDYPKDVNHKRHYWMKDPSSKDRKRSGSASHWFGVKISENWRDNATTNSSKAN